MKRFVLFSLIFVAVVTAVFLGRLAKPSAVYAQCSSCGDIGDDPSCSACGGRFFCTCGCDVLCYPPNNCACEATLCQTSPNCVACGPDLIYGGCLTCLWCGGTPENCSFNCPDTYNPCLNECDGGEPTPTPVPTVPPGDPTPTPAPVCTAPTGLNGSSSCDGGDGLINITWTWDSVPGATGYIINIDNNSDFSSPELSIFTGSANYTAVNLAPGTWYARVRVNSSDATCNAPSEWSSTASVTNLCAACAPPLNNTPASACISQTTYDTTWYFSESAGANEYQFVVSTGSGVNFFTNVVYSSGWQISSFFACAGGSCNLPMTGFTSGITYYSLVQARGLSCPVSSWSNEQSVFQNCFLACPAPILSSSGSSCDTGDTLVDITWQWNDLGSTGATSYRLQVDASPADWVGMAFNQILTPGVNLTCNGVSCTYTTTNLVPGTWNARVIVLTSDGIGCTVNPVGWSTTASYTDQCLTQVVGQVFNDPFGEALPAGIGGMCQLVGASGVQPGAGSSVTVNPGGYVDPTINLDGTFAVPAIPPNIPPGAGYTSSLDPAGDWACTCPSTCLYSVDVPQDIPPDEALRYYVSEIQDTWFQTVGGDVHAKGNILSSIPATCSGSCTPQFSLPGGDEVGVVTSSSGPGNYGSGTVSDLATRGWEATSIYNGPRYLFDFWRKETDTPTLLASLDDKPSPAQGIYEITASSDLTLTGNWTNIPQTLTIFVNFSDPAYSLILNPNDPGITMVAPGLLTIITNGNIRVADTVTSIEGIFLTDGVFRSCVTDDCGYDIGTGTAYQLQVRGSVIAWGGFDLQRDLFVGNRTTPAELFTYEPDFIPRLPEFMLRALYTWEEVKP